MKEQKTVVVGLSGGVDSAVSALLLKKQGYHVIGAFMKNFSDSRNLLTGECSWLQEKRMAQRVASHLGIPFKLFDFEKQYKSQVISLMINSYSRGLTPNPDSLCNKVIKFPLFWKKAKNLGADYMAMGHYIRKIKKKDGYHLLKAKDSKKDQSYFLFELGQKDLEHTIFPIGNYTKEEIRKIAKNNKLPNYDKKGTAGICFVGPVNIKSFLEKEIKNKPGVIKNPENEKIGEHPGIMYFTIGQRLGEKSGFEISKDYRNKTKKKLYIAGKNLKNNVLTIAPENHPALFRKEFRLINFHMINPKSRIPKNCKVKIRHLGEEVGANISEYRGKIICSLKKAVTGVAEGQSAVIYNKKEVLGGGEIRFS